LQVDGAIEVLLSGAVGMQLTGAAAANIHPKTKARVSTEMSLHVLAYNMKRMINILGVGALMKVMST